MRSTVLITLSIISHVALIVVVVVSVRRHFEEPATPPSPITQVLAPEASPATATADSGTTTTPAETSAAASAPAEIAPVTEPAEAAPKAEPKNVEPKIEAKSEAKNDAPIAATPKKKHARHHKVVARLEDADVREAKTPKKVEPTEDAAPEFIPVKETAPDGVEAALDSATEAVQKDAAAGEAKTEAKELVSNPVSTAEDKATPPEAKDGKGSVDLIDKATAEAQAKEEADTKAKADAQAKTEADAKAQAAALEAAKNPAAENASPKGDAKAEDVKPEDVKPKEVQANVDATAPVETKAADAKVEAATESVTAPKEAAPAEDVKSEEQDAATETPAPKPQEEPAVAPAKQKSQVGQADDN